MRLADLDRAQMGNASNLNRADLDGANLAQADLRNADLSCVSGAGPTNLVDAQLGARAPGIASSVCLAHSPRQYGKGQTCVAADLEGPTWNTRTLSRALFCSPQRLPDAHLQKCTPPERPIFIGANLRGTDLGGASFQEQF